MKRKITISEQQIINAVRKIINEARRNSETNIDESFADFYNRMIQKAPRENIFVSFREETHVTDVNPVNKYRTPTGYYSYPLSSFDIDENPSEVEFRRSFPFANHREYINFFILKNHDGILTGKTDKSTLDMYVDRIKKLYPTMDKIGNLCDLFINNKYTSDYINKDPDRKVHHGTHLFWLFLYDIAKAVQAGNTQNRINLICRKIGVNGFVDYEGKEYIHSAEPKQSVFFKVKNLGEVFIYEKPKISDNTFKNAIQNKEYEFIKYLANDIKIIKVFNKYSLTNKNDEIISKQWFDSIGDFEDGLARVRSKNGYNFINQKGELISNQWFDWASNFKGGLAIVELDSKYNLINKNGKILSKQWFGTITYFGDEVYIVKLNNKWNIINQNFKLLFPNQWFDGIDEVNEDIIKVILNNKFGLIDQNGELISKQWFDWISIFDDGVARVQLKGKHNFINEKGDILFSQWFDRITYFEGSSAKVKISDKMYEVDLNNKSINEIN